MHLVELEAVVPVVPPEEEGAAEGAQASVLRVPVFVVGEEGHLLQGVGEGEGGGAMDASKEW
jgi:hypothetical protein